MNEPRPVSQQGSSQGSSQGIQQGPAASRPLGVGAAPAQRLPGVAAAQRPVAQPTHHAAGLVQPARAAPSPASIPIDDDLINLEDDDVAVPAPSAVRFAPAAPTPAAASTAPLASAPPVSKIRLSGGGDKHSYTKFKRAALADGHGACRLRSFHGRLSDEGLAFMDDKINEWLDNHPEVEVKHVNTVIGPIEGKNGEQAMFVTIWY